MGILLYITISVLATELFRYSLKVMVAVADVLRASG